MLKQADRVVRIAIDAMGGDFGPSVTVPGMLKAMKDLGADKVSFLLYGDEREIRPILNKYPQLNSITEVHHTDYVVANDEKPSIALRTGRHSSMRLAINAVKEGHADCIVSAGNTGALMAMAKMVMKCLPGIHRPAIGSVFPSIGDDIVMLDLGANLQCDEEVLAQFAILGTVYARVVQGIERPSVALLNIGSEEMKGHEEIRAAAAILSQVDFPGNFVGFVEGSDVPMGKVHVVVADGFTGNIALKMAEGVGKMSTHLMRNAFKSSVFAFLGYLLSKRALRRMKDRIDPRVYNGGMFLGLAGVCVKSHGGSDDIGFSYAIKGAYKLVSNRFNERVAEEIEELMSQESFITKDIFKEA